MEKERHTDTDTVRQTQRRHTDRHREGIQTDTETSIQTYR